VPLLSANESSESVCGFDIRPGDSDGIDLRPLFDAIGYAGTTPRASGYLRFSQSGSTARQAPLRTASSCFSSGLACAFPVRVFGGRPPRACDNTCLIEGSAATPSALPAFQLAAPANHPYGPHAP
jgi:hypothetical protein